MHGCGNSVQEPAHPRPRSAGPRGCPNCQPVSIPQARRFVRTAGPALDKVSAKEVTGWRRPLPALPKYPVDEIALSAMSISPATLRGGNHGVSRGSANPRPSLGRGSFLSFVARFLNPHGLATISSSLTVKGEPIPAQARSTRNQSSFYGPVRRPVPSAGTYTYQRVRPQRFASPNRPSANLGTANNSSVAVDEMRSNAFTPGGSANVYIPLAALMNYPELQARSLHAGRGGGWG